MYYISSPLDFRNNQELIMDISKAIDGEYSAINCYKKLQQLAPNEKARTVIKEIRQDEKRHFKSFNRIYTQLTGQSHSPQLNNQCPNSYKSGLDFSFNDEQHSVDFYLEIADKAVDPYIKEQFNRAAKDEQNHAVWFLYLMNRG
ncbi:rubrerythrin [Cytobacillus horneckiae]|uniref:Rubrerythrin family protein n=1 Tax=Cytobacillus horneckiae TaxID=549687 RepID=A0A2N0ZE16_9BACI|nr:ferritin-like domain-containing protein [Cytobacillus horneckiae]MBN6888963.1 ferritin-like domain-containing protein [Cytobacillus horneckiae]MCM3180849.1 ferritin-like domain-containing protein [Cytobacillus horneckiae]MEC1157445.1 ferritin-like domain-containing protein [Cytobacillus horneckiae]MED2939395.1 ferritin-like domain-containing protein [Cytobacillus horneckiae]PKG27735.1 rubrerythrin family protein [Cytobacillus horneckiae]